MKRCACFLLLLLSLTVSARAVRLPAELRTALPRQANELLGETDGTDAGSLGEKVLQLFHKVGAGGRAVLRQRLKGAISILLIVLLCGLLDGFRQSTGTPEMIDLTPVAGALSVTLLSAGSLDSLMGLGAETMEQLGSFSKVLLPALAAAAAAGGAVGTAGVQQVTTVFFADLLLSLINGLLMPMVYLYIGTLTAGAMLPDNRLTVLADGIKKTITWILSASLIAFTIYLSVVHVIAGSADTAAVKVAKAAISGAVPVVGSILAEASETVLAGAGLLKNTIGIFGTLAVLAICAYPFLQLGIQYILYKFTAFLAGTVGAPNLCRLIDGLGGAFGLVLGMTGACALLLLISILSSVAAVVP